MIRNLEISGHHTIKALCLQVIDNFINYIQKYNGKK